MSECPHELPILGFLSLHVKPAHPFQEEVSPKEA